MTGYQGWKNYETWLFALWFSNDQYTHEETSRVVTEIRESVIEQHTRDILREHGFDADRIEELFAAKEDIPGDAADALKEWVEDHLYEILDNAKLDGTIFSDLLRNAVSEVDWLEWAKNLLEE